MQTRDRSDGSTDLAVQHDDRFADCVRLRIIPALADPSRLRLEFELSFADMWLDMETRKYRVLREAWRFRFAIRGGELSLVLNRLASRTTERNFHRMLPRTQAVQHTASTETAGSFESSGTLAAGSASWIPEGSIRLSAGRSRADKRTATDAYPRQQVVIYHKGSEESPKWVIRTDTVDGVLLGSVHDWLATLDIVGRPFSVNAAFTTSLNGVCILEVDNHEFDTTSDRRKRILTRVMQKFVRDSVEEGVSTAVVRSRREEPR
jgi:hypothetical protein